MEEIDLHLLILSNLGWIIDLSYAQFALGSWNRDLIIHVKFELQIERSIKDKRKINVLKKKSKFFLLKQRKKKKFTLQYYNFFKDEI